MKEYINKILKFLLQIVQKKRKRTYYTFNTIYTDIEVATTEIKSQEISSEQIPNFQEETKTIQKNKISDIVLEQLPIEFEENINEEIQNNLINQIKYDNAVQIELVVNEPEIKYDTIESEREPKVLSEDDIKGADKTSVKEELITKNRVDETIYPVISHCKDTEDKQQLAETPKKRITTKIGLKQDMDELLQKINRIFIEHKLIGNYDFTEDEYSELLETVGLLCRSLLNYGSVFDDKYHKLIFITLVEISKRWKDFDNEDETEENSRFWNNIFKHLINDDEFNQKLYHAFTDVITQLERQHLLPIVLIGKKFYSTLMMHSFAPKNSIFSFYDLCYNIFKKDLDFGFTKDDEWQCDRFASEIANFLGYGYREDKKVAIGSSAYSIKIGLRSFALNEGLFTYFVEFIKDTLFQINKLFYKEPINENTRLERYITEWWKNKTELEKASDDSERKRRVPTVSKENIVAKYIREENSVFLLIPSIRLDNENSIVVLTVFVNEEKILSQEIRTKRGVLVVETKQIELELNDLLRYYDTINLRVEIKENHTIIFNSESNKATSLNREFILFEGEKEVLSQINKPSNYFVYSKDIDVLKNVPEELSTYGTNLYNIYPKAGESLTGNAKQFLFEDKSITSVLGKKACLIGSLLDVEWHIGEISCIVYTKNMKLIIPENFNLKSLELRINKKAYKLNELNFERMESGCYQFGLKTIGLIVENQPAEINLFSYENESISLSETIIILPNLEIKFNYPFYYGDLERKLTVYNSGDPLELTWSNQGNEIRCPVNDGLLLIKIPYLRWRINDNEWYNEPNNKKLWYKDFLSNGDKLEIDNPNEIDDFKIFCKTNEKSFEIVKNQNGKFEIGRAIYANENITDISVYINLGKEIFEIFTVFTKEHFIANPLTYSDGKVFWNVEDSFVGEKTSDFFLIIKSADNNFRSKFNYKNSEIKNLHDDICKIQVKIKDKNIFSKAENYQLIYEGELLIGTPEKLRFKNKKISLLSANCFDSKKSEWIPFIPKYFIDKLKFVQEDETIYYTGQLCVIDHKGEIRVLNTMINEKGTYDEINPVRIELRDNRTLWLAAGWEEGELPLGNLFCDKLRKGICNIQKQDYHFGEIYLYKFKEEDYV